MFEKKIKKSIQSVEAIMNNKVKNTDSTSSQLELLSFVLVFGEYCSKDLLSSLREKAVEIGCSSEEIETAFSDAECSENKPILDESIFRTVDGTVNEFSIVIEEE